MPTTKTEIAGGAVPISVSGQPVQISGQPVQISGQTINALISGQFVLISGQSVLVSGQPIAISGQVVIVSGQMVNVSGQPVQISGQTIVAQFASGVSIPASISGQPVLISGQSVSVIISGQVVIISGQFVSISGQPVAISGQMLDRTWRLSGLTDSVAISGQPVAISGQMLDRTWALSGLTDSVAISGQTIVAQFASGVSLPVSISGQPVLISGQPVSVIISGQVVNISGQSMGRTWVLSGLTDSVAISGQTILAQFASGVSLPVSISGQPVGISGEAVVISGQFVNISGQSMGRTWVLSGLTDSVAISGQTIVAQFASGVAIPTSISGQPVQVSGQTVITQFASGVTFPVDISGQTIITQFASGVSIPTSISGQPVGISGQAVVVSGQGIQIIGPNITPSPISSYYSVVGSSFTNAVVTSGGALMIAAGFEVDPNNSTTTLLGIGGLFIGTYRDLTGYSQISISVTSDVPSTANGFAVIFSNDGVNTDDIKVYTVLGSITVAIHTPVNAKFYKIFYQNGATPQAFFRIQSILNPIPSLAGISQLVLPLHATHDVMNTRAVIAGLPSIGVQTYADAMVTSGGRLLTESIISGQIVNTSGQVANISGQGIQILGPNITFSPTSSFYNVVGSSFTNAVLTSGGAVMIAAGFEVDPNNSTTAILGIGGSFIGTIRDLTGYSQITVGVIADAPGTLAINFYSATGGGFIEQKRFAILSLNEESIHLPVNAKSYYIQYTNGAVAQSVFTLQAILNPIPSVSTIRNVDRPIISDYDAMVTHSVIAGPIAVRGSSFTDVVVTVDGKFSTLAAISGQAVVVSGQVVNISGQIVNISGEAVNISGAGIKIIGQNIVALPADTRFNVVGSSFADVVTTSGGALMVANGLEPDANNITTTALGIGASYNGTFRDLTGYSQITINVVTDVPGTLIVAFATGFATGSTETKSYSILGLYPETIHIPVNAKFYRVTYTNGAVAQVILRIQSLLTPIPSVGTVRNIDRPIESEMDSMITHTVVAGPIAVGGSSFTDNVVLPDGQALVQVNQSGQVFGVDGYNKALIQEDVIHRKIHQGTYFYADVSQSTNLSNPASYAITQMSGVNPHLSWHFRGLIPGMLVNVLEVTSARQTTGTVSSNIFLNRTITAFTSTRLYSSYVLGSNVGANSILFETQASGETAYGFGNLYTYPLIPAEWVLKGGFTYVFQILSAQLPSLTTLYANWYESGLA